MPDSDKPAPRQRQVSLALGTYDRFTELKEQLSAELNRKVNYSELLDQLIREHQQHAGGEQR